MVGEVIQLDLLQEQLLKELQQLVLYPEILLSVNITEMLAREYFSNL
jgi:hypothetical protein